MAEEKEEKGFVIKDRRIFGEEGEGEDKRSVTDEKGEPEGKPDLAQDQKDSEANAGPTEEESRQIPEVDFASFIISLYTSAAFHFGDMADPATGKKEKNLPAAKQMIDIISLLKEKTNGNLDENESQLIEGLLYELRMRYVKES